ncbi:MAG: hypothetical protein LWY06_14025 [Firmicutes bacterium]|nr:hypothetical protein [Bacillota bacterium]
MTDTEVKETKPVEKKSSWLKYLLLLLIPLAGWGLYQGYWIIFPDKDTISLPLVPGHQFVYSGVYKSRSGGAKPITLTADNHRIVVERELDFEGQKRYFVAFYQGEYNLARIILSQDDQGIYTVSGRNHKTLSIPREVRRGQSWNYEFGSTKITGTVGPRKIIKTGLGDLEGREITLTSSEHNTIKLWINNEYGIIAFNYKFVFQGSNESEAELILKSEGEVGKGE